MLKDTIYITGHLTTPRSNITEKVETLQGKSHEWFLKFFTYDRSNEGLTLETSAFESLYGGQFTFICQLS